MKPKRGARAIAASLLVGSWATTCLAYRPFDGTDADVAEPRELEIEAGALGYTRVGSRSLLVAPALVLSYGFAAGFEAVLEGRQQWIVKAPVRSELDDVALSLKSVARAGSLQGGEGVSVGLETGMLLPGSESRFGLHLASVFSWSFPALTLHLNLGNELLASVRYEASSSLILEGPQSWRVRPVAELLAARDFGRRNLRQGLGGSVLVGVIASWGDAWSIDLAVRHGRADGVNENEARAGLTWAFEGP
jgi:hypothetical protein